MSLADLLLILARTGVILTMTLVAGLLARRAPAFRLSIYRLGLFTAIVAAVASPWLRESPRPIVPVQWSVASTLPTPVNVSPKTHPTAKATTATENPFATTSESTFDPLTLVGPIYLVVSGLLLLRLVIGYAGLARIRRRCQLVGCPEAAETARAFGLRPPRVVEGAIVGGPFVAGLLRPTIFLPSDWLLTAESEVRQAVLRHEIAHVANGDLRWGLFGRLAQIALWPQPLLWLLGRPMEVAGEELCDVQALASGIPDTQYANCLLTLRAAPAPLLGIGATASRSSLSRRIEAILDARRSRATRLSRSASIALRLAAIGLAAGTAFVFARPTSSLAAQDPFANWIKKPYEGRVRLSGPNGKPVVAAQAWVIVTGGVPETRSQKLPIEGGEVVLGQLDYPTETRGTLVVRAKGVGLGFVPLWPTPQPVKELSLPASVSLKGRLLLPGGKPAAQIKVETTIVVRKVGDDFQFVEAKSVPALGLEAISGADGGFQIDGLPPSVNLGYDVDDDRFAHPRFTDRSDLGVERVFQARDLKLKLAARFTGRVTQDGKPVAGLKIGAQGNHLKSPGFSDGYGDAMTDADGRYSIERLPEGAYNVALELRARPDVTAIAHEGVDATAGGTVANLDFELIPGVFIEGRVTDLSGKGVQTELGVYGPAHPKSSAWVQTGKTDSKGHYRLRVPPGEQYVYLYDSRFKAPAQTVRVGSEGTTFNFEVSPAPVESRPQAVAVKAPASDNAVAEERKEDRDPGPVPPVASFGPGRTFFGPFRLKAGGTVRLAYLQDDVDAHHLWWPDGGSAAAAEIAQSLNMKEFGSHGRDSPRTVFARIETTGVHLDGFNCVVQVPQRSNWSVYQSYGSEDRTLDLVTFRAPHALKVSDLRLGIAAGPWSVVQSGQAGAVGRLAPRGPVSITVPISSALEKQNVMVRVIDRRGGELELTMMSENSVDPKTGLPSRTFEFQGSPEDVARIDLLVRDYEWVTFKGIQLYAK